MVVIRRRPIAVWRCVPLLLRCDSGELLVVVAGARRQTDSVLWGSPAPTKYGQRRRRRLSLDEAVVFQEHDSRRGGSPSGGCEGKHHVLCRCRPLCHAGSAGKLGIVTKVIRESSHPPLCDQFHLDADMPYHDHCVLNHGVDNNLKWKVAFVPWTSVVVLRRRWMQVYRCSTQADWGR